MVKLLLRCPECHKYFIDKEHLETPNSSNQRLAKNICQSCNTVLRTPHPPKFSMENKYLKYIRELKKKTS